MKNLRQYATKNGLKSIVAAIDCECLDDLSDKILRDLVRDCSRISADPKASPALRRAAEDLLDMLD